MKELLNYTVIFNGWRSKMGRLAYEDWEQRWNQIFEKYDEKSVASAAIYYYCTNGEV